MDEEQQRVARTRMAVLPPLSSRTLQHPSFLPLYMAAGYARCCRDSHSLTGPTITPQEIFYCDPTTGRRIPNVVSELHNLECLRLTTPPPIMSCCPAPPIRPDPFRTQPYPVRDLGSSTWRQQVDQPPELTNQGVVQLSQEEDEAITNLLALRYKGDGVRAHCDRVISDQKRDGPSPSGSEYSWTTGMEKPREGAAWSDLERVAVDTLLNRLTDEDEELCDPPGPGGLADTPHGADARVSCCDERVDTEARQAQEAVDLSRLRGGVLSESEGNAIHVLLSLQDVGTLRTLH